MLSAINSIKLCIPIVMLALIGYVLYQGKDIKTSITDLFGLATDLQDQATDYVEDAATDYVEDEMEAQLEGFSSIGCTDDSDCSEGAVCNEKTDKCWYIE